MRDLSSARLILRRPAPTDAPFLRLLRPTAAQEPGRADVEAWIALAGRAGAPDYGGWVVTLRSDRRRIGVLLYGRDSGAEDCAEIAIEIEPGSRGQGYGKEALRRAMRHLTHDIRFPGLSAYIAESNPASASLFTSVGFRPPSDGVVLIEGGMASPALRFSYSREPRRTPKSLPASP